DPGFGQTPRLDHGIGYPRLLTPFKTLANDLLVPNVVGIEPHYLVPFREPAFRRRLDINRKNNVLLLTGRSRQGTKRSVGGGFHLPGLFVEKTRKQKKALMQPLESQLALRNAPFAKDHGLFPRSESFGD